MNGRERNEFCSYCGLPLSKGLWFRRSRRANADLSDVSNKQGQPRDSLPATATSPEYCCSGCRFAAEVTAELRPGKAINRPVARLGIAVFLTINVVMFTMVLWSDDIYSQSLPKSAGRQSLPADALSGDVLADTFRWLSLLLTSGVVWLLSGPLALNAWQELRRGVAAVDLLLLSGVAAAYGYSCVSVIQGTGHLYFEVTCVVLVLVTLGRWLESLGKIRAAGAIESLAKLLPPQVIRLTCDGEETVPLAQLRRGDRIRTMAGQRIATDGHVVSGSAYVDEQLVTGESNCATKQPGDRILGGTLNVDGTLIVEADGDYGSGTVERMVESLRQGRLVRGRYQQFADRVAAWFLPVAAVVAVATLIWHNHETSLENGVLAAMAVVLIACPCALGLATPLAIWSALGRASVNQVLVRHGDALERLAATHTIVFDKTGTLSSGDATVQRLIVGEEESAGHVLKQAYWLASNSTHPYSAAVARFVAESQTPQESSVPGLASIQTLPGKGLCGVESDGRKIFFGSQLLMDEMGLNMSPALRSQIEQYDSQFPAWVMIGWDQQVRGAFMIHEQVRPAAKSVLAELQSMGIDLLVLSGDRKERAKEFARCIDVPVRGGLLPHDKVAAIDSVRQRAAGVVMVGDGLNDAAALGAADVGIALGCGSDISREAADVCLLGNDLARIPWLIQLARKTVRVIRQNLFWSFAYNSIGIVMAVSGTLNPIWAAAAMMFSSFFVVANSLRLGVSGNHSASESISSSDHPGDHLTAYATIPSPAPFRPEAEELVRAS